ncbi:hypothetical protein LAZ67_19001219 [Cordylochernes scorpioides]|uniref:Transposase n=1 Tax=Cordylochernes scorpioides TaxID=51811 RepID=A0ABY6LHS8_9ARAC|nr:hypothetical protein LAZ67_19001219 [Cordylochernes scorpioides]
MTRTDPEWMQKIITGNETWVYQYDPVTKRQSSQWIEKGEPKPKKARFTKSKVKTLLVTFFDINEVFLGIMRRLRKAVRLKSPERWQNNDWILHVDNARPHTAHVVLQFLAKHSTIQMPHPPYPPDIAPNDFFLYPKLKMKLKGRKYDNVDMIQAESKATLRNLSKSDLSPASTIGKKDETGLTLELTVEDSFSGDNNCNGAAIDVTTGRESYGAHDKKRFPLEVTLCRNCYGDNNDSDMELKIGSKLIWSYNGKKFAIELTLGRVLSGANNGKIVSMEQIIVTELKRIGMGKELLWKSHGEEIC